MKIPIRAAQNKQKGRMRPAGRQFDMPAVENKKRLNDITYFGYFTLLRKEDDENIEESVLALLLMW
jgi:hypothetical protein